MIATIIDTKALLQTVGFAFGAGVGVALSFSLAILGATKLSEVGRDRPVEGWAWAMLAIAGLCVTIAAIVFGIVVMTAK